MASIVQKTCRVQQRHTSLEVINSSMIYLKHPPQQKEHHEWDWTPSQLPRASDVIDLGGEPTTAIVLSQHDPKLHSKYLSL